MTKELNNLLSLLFQDARTVVKDGRLLVPPEIAKRFGDQIKKFKPEILLALGHCPICGRELVVEVGQAWITDQEGKTKVGTHSCCPDLEQKHFDKWEF